MFRPAILIVLAAALLAAFAPPAAAQDADTQPGSDLFYSANALYNRKLYVVAIKEYQGFLQKYPNHPKAEQARYGLALSHYALGSCKEAEPLLRDLAARGTAADRNQLNLLRAHCLLALNNPAEAEKLFAAIAADKGAQAFARDAQAGLSDALFKQQKWPETIEAAGKLAAMGAGPDLTARGLYQAGWARHALGKFAEAIPGLEKLRELEIGDEPLRQRTAYLLAECYRETGALDKSAAAYAEAAAGVTGETAGEIQYRIGFVHFAAGRYPEAMAAFDQAIRLHPKGAFVPSAALYIGRAWLEKGEFERARQALDGPSRAQDQTGAEATLWLARVYARQKKHADAARILAPAVGRFAGAPALPDLLFDLANALIAQSDFAGAVKPLTQLAGNKDFARRNDVLRMLAVSTHRAGDYAGSLRTADEFIAAYAADPLRHEVDFVRAEDLFLLGRLDDALGAHRAFLAAHPQSPSVDAAAFRVGQILHRKGEWQPVLDVLLPLAAREPKDELFAQLRFVVGDAFFRLEKWDEAVTHLEAFVAEAYERQKRSRDRKWEPNTDAARVELAVAFQNKGDEAAAAGQYKALLANHGDSPHVPVALAQLGRQQYEAQDYRGARDTLQRLSTQYAQDPRRAQAEYYLGWIAHAESKEEEAAQHFAAVWKSYPKDPLAADAGLQWGLTLIGLGKFKDAQGALDELLRAHPKHPRRDLAMYSLGVALARQEDWNRAATYFQGMLGEAPASDVADRALYEWAWCEKGRKKPQEAVRRYRELLEKHPASELADKARTELAELTFDAKEYDQVIAQLRESLNSITDKPLREQTKYRLGTAHFNKGDYEAAANTFESMLAEFPRSALAASARFQAGEARLKLKETVAARDHFAASAQANDARIMESVLMRLGETQGLTRQWNESAGTYGRFLQQYPESQWKARARFGLAWALEQMDRHNEAMTEYRRVIADARKHDELAAHAQFQVGECLFAMKMYDAALQELVKVQVNYRFKDWSAKALLEMARALEAKGDAERAQEQYREVIAKYADHDAAIVAKQRLDVLRRTQ